MIFLLSFRIPELSKSRTLKTKARMLFFARSTVVKLSLSHPCVLICSQILSVDAIESESLCCGTIPYFKPYGRAEYRSFVIGVLII